MKNLTIKQGMSGLNDNDFKDRCDNVVTGLTGNANFPLTAALIAPVATKVKEFGMLVATSKGESKSPRITLAKNLKRKEINKDMRRIFNAVEAQGVTDVTILTSSGFPLAKTPEPVEGLGQCQNFTLMIGPATGECSLHVEKLKGAKSYLFQCTETVTPEIDNWLSFPSTDTRGTMTGLKPGTRYTYRVCGVNGKGMGSWSDYIIRFMS